MSDDHKPEDPSEQDRIVNAGGHVTCDGRVNGGLNLSRALGTNFAFTLSEFFIFSTNTKNGWFKTIGYKKLKTKMIG